MQPLVFPSLKRRGHFLMTGSTLILCGDSRQMLKRLPDNCINTCFTSPPYFQLREYGTASWEGGSADCNHRAPSSQQTRSSQDFAHSSRKAKPDQATSFVNLERTVCRKCGAVRVDAQVGQEPTIDGYIKSLVDVFSEVRRVLHPTGTLWLNLGDSFSTELQSVGSVKNALKPKDISFIPERVAMALQIDGWWVRSKIVWQKMNPIPEPIEDRPTCSHELIFLLARQSRYFFDQEAVRESVKPGNQATSAGVSGSHYTKIPAGQHRPNKQRQYSVLKGANIRDVWSPPPETSSEPHAAQFPLYLPRRGVLAGTSEVGRCPTCYSPWVRELEKTKARVGTPRSSTFTSAEDSKARRGSDFVGASSRTLGWKQLCDCPPHTPEPCVVLDCFGGVGTTALAACHAARNAVLCELNPAYVARTIKRLGRAEIQASELKDVPVARRRSK
jgi:DNA modification methylase